ncbi:MAG: HK97 family phage prohead protease [Tessaracoccus sp.]|uniref:HK97 family phage prohead protease n=1 Tax=Tessaracoccus sp. TaxID=1971211 RepID=UPI001ED4C066|nr:HK97 family phage prohead protease [Tessaracoccus sp.]MBK7823610.1 HK97 family phage prohead protease [Tessaracoccus sp.]
MNDIVSAAAARCAGVAQRSHRPAQRRCADVAAVPGAVPHVGFRSHMLLREAAGDGAPLTFEGHASTYEQPYEDVGRLGPYTEVVSAGAAAESLATPGLDVPLVLAHDQLRRIASTPNGSLVLSEDEQGLRVVADLDPADADVAYIAPKLRAGLVSEMSFGFRITAGSWSPDYTEFRIAKFDIHRGDVAIVGFGANPYTEGGLRSADAGRDATLHTLRARLALAAAL